MKKKLNKKVSCKKKMGYLYDYGRILSKFKVKNIREYNKMTKFAKIMCSYVNRERHTILTKSLFTQEPPLTKRRNYKKLQ